MIAIPNMEKPKSCQECPIRIAETMGVYYDSKSDEYKRVKITGCDEAKYHTKTLGEGYKMLYKDCPLIDIDDELIQEELTKMAWCEGFSDGFTKAQETISNYIKRMGFTVEIPNAHELYMRLKGE